MNALNLLRNLLLLLTLLLAASSVSAAEGEKNTRSGAKPHVVRTAKPQRKVVAAFVDPTLPLAGFVERIRLESAR